jgi:osmoprotectant transport system substrate-binding protein
MRPTRTLLATVVAGLLAITACGGGGDPLATNSTKPASESAGRDTITVGSANFPEAVLLGEIYAGALEAKGVQVQRKLNIGSRETYIKGLEDGSLDLVPEYTGVLLQYYDPDATAAKPDEVYAALREVLPSGLTVLEMSSAEDKDAVVVTRETAEKYDLTSIEDPSRTRRRWSWAVRPSGRPDRPVSRA